MKKILGILLFIVLLLLMSGCSTKKEAKYNLSSYLFNTEIMNRYDSLNNVLDTLKIEFDNRRKEIEENNKAIEKNNETLREIIQSMKYRNENLIINNK